MRDELRMDYIERLKHAAIPLGTIAVARRWRKTN
jgi:hypothetical protein